MKSDQFQLHADVEETHWWFVGRRRIMRELVRRVLPPSMDSTVVDVGCGTGANIAALAGDYDCVGIDPSAEAIQFARQRFPGVEFIQGRAPEDIPEIMGRADLILLMDVLEHVPDDFAFLSALLAASSPGARFLITVPANPSLWTRHDESNGHYRRYETRRLSRVWEGLPVSARFLSFYCSRLYPIAKAVRMLNQWRGGVIGRAGTDVRVPSRPANAVLERVFAGEARVLVDLLEGRRRRGFGAGVSLITLLQREPGEIQSRTMPSDLAPDPFNSAEARLSPATP